MDNDDRIPDDLDLSKLSPEEVREVARKITFEAYHKAQAEQNPPAPEPSPEPSAATAPEAYGLDPELVHADAIQAAEESDAIRKRQQNLRALAEQTLIDRGEIAKAEDVSGMPTNDVLVLAGFTKSEAQKRLEADAEVMNDPAKLREYELGRQRNHLIDGWLWEPGDKHAKAKALGLDPAEIDAYHLEEAKRRNG